MYASEYPFLRWIATIFTRSRSHQARLLSRTKYFDQLLRDGILNENVKQIVEFGSGYTTKPLRFYNILTKNDVKYYEIDLLQNLNYKKSILSQKHIIDFLGFNFTEQDCFVTVEANLVE